MQKVDRLGWAAGFSVRAYGVKIGIRSNRPDLIDRIWRYLPHGCKVIPSPLVDRIYSIIIGGEGERQNLRRFSLLYGDQVRLVRSVNVEEVFDRLESDLRLFVADLARDRVFVHAGVVAWKGKAIVIPGRSYSGKSTLVAELIRAGATYYSDEYAVFDKRGRVHPFPKDLEMRVTGDWLQTRQGVESFGSRTGTRPIPVGKILVTEYKSGNKWRPRQLSAGKAVLALLSNTVSARRHPEKVLATLQKVVAEARTFHGRRGEAQEIVPLILDRVEKNR